MELIRGVQWFFTDSSSKAQNARRAIKILILVALFFGLFWIVPFEEVLDAMLAAEPLYLAVGLALSFASTCLTAVQMTVLVRKQRINLGLRQVLAINLAAKFYSQFAPGNIVASGVKWYRLSQPDGKPAEALAALAFFRLLETFLNVALGLCFWYLSGQESFRINAWWLVVLIIGTTLLWFILTRYSLPIYSWFKSWGWGIWEKQRWQSISKRLEKFLLAVVAYADLSAWELCIAILAGVSSQMAGVTSNLFIGRSVGIELSFMDMGWIYSVVILLSQMPFAFAGGLGVREVSLVFMFSTFGIGPEIALYLPF